MCGIAGYVQRTPAPRTLEAMLEPIASRGPDASGTWYGEHGGWHVGLGHRRLSIIDIAGGAQPMGLPGDAAVITYNGEVYNFRELRSAMERAGARFVSNNDTEVVLQRMVASGPSALADFNGMFAFALWSARDGKLLLARDPMGIKPLYYAPLPDGGIAFGSELGAVLRHPGVGRRGSRLGLRSYFFSDFAHPPLTVVEGVYKLEPGHYVVHEQGRLSRSEPFVTWQAEEGSSRPREDLAKELWERLGEAVLRQLVADVPVGVLLSGGIDSSSVAVLAARHVRRLQTFCVGFRGMSFDESRYARLVADQVGSDHHEEILDEENLLEVLHEALQRLDEPLADHSYLPTYLLARMAARHVKVVLGGDGGDELWGGYPTYRAHLYASLYRWVPDVLHRMLVRTVVSRLPTSTRYQGWDWKIRKFAGQWDRDVRRRHLRWMSTLDLDELESAIPVEGAPPPATLTCQRFPDLGSTMKNVMALDLFGYLPGSVLCKVDRASMAHSLEVRPPFLDARFVRWSLQQPARYKVNWRDGKLLLKQAAAPHLPPAIIHRAKRGFGMPVVAWMRGPLAPRVDQALANRELWRSGMLRREPFARWAELHKAGRADYGKCLWALVVLDSFVRRERIEL